MHEGKIEQIGTSVDIYNRPATPFVASFVGAANVIRGLVIEGKLQFGEQQLAGAGNMSDGSSAHAYVRPHDILVSPHRQNGNSLPGRIERINDLGWVSKVGLSFAGGQLLTAELLNDTMEGLKVGQQVWIDLRNARIFPPEGPVLPPSDELASF